jgi:alginate O-acetyltransferase complex protein AlgI
VHFASFDWLAWMVATVTAYWLVPRQWRGALLASASLAFLVLYAPDSALLLVLFTAWLALVVVPGPERLPGWRLAVGALPLIVVLALYKVRAGHANGDMYRDIVIPLGMSYYTFRCVAYAIERYRGTLPADGAADLVRYLLFLPTIVIGPIHRFAEFVRDHRRQRWDGAAFGEGIERVIYGYVKITFVANYLLFELGSDFLAGLPDPDGPLALYLEIVRRGLQIYIVFSGFSDVAIGFALLLGYRIIENFDWPYLQKNISAFWRCWHISLTRWSREYVYNVVVASSRSPALGALASLLFIGLWHEISVRYIVWGLLHGFAIVVWQQFQKLKSRLPSVDSRLGRRLLDGVCVLLTVHFVWFSFALVTEPTAADGATMILTVLAFWM